MNTLRGNTFVWKYQETEVLGSGGNSIVYKAYRDHDAVTPFALKLFTDHTVSPKKLIRFTQEITTLESLRGTYGCSELIDYGTDDQRPFYVMPFYSGGDLHKKFIKFAPVPRDVFGALNLFVKVTEIVRDLHSEPRVLAVRDIKPQNILLNSDGQPVVCDFGLALWADTPDEDRITTQKGVGSAGYRPPEWATVYPGSKQIQGDIWSLGRTLWAILSARVPPANYESLGTSTWHLKNFLQDGTVAQALQGLVNQCTQIQPDRRPTAIELLEAARSTLKYCTDHDRGNRGSTLDDQLSEIAMLLPGSDLLVTAAQKKADLDSKYIEIDDCQNMLLARIREFEQKLSGAFSKDSGSFIIGGRERYRDVASYRANVYIRFIPSVALQDTNMGRESRYVFHFGLNSNNDFFWTETAQVDGMDSEQELINPKSLTTLAAQKCGQIESILKDYVIPEIQRMLGMKPPVGAMTMFSNGNQSGSADFDYSSNDGVYAIGSGNWRFEIVWSKASDEAIHVARPKGENTGIAIALGATRFWEIKKLSIYDFSSRIRTPEIGQIVILKNQFGYYAAVRIKEIWDNSRGKDRDRLQFDFVILDNKSTDFSSTQ